MNIIHHPSPNQDARKSGALIKWVILHYTALLDTGTSLEWLCNPKKSVSAHYLICRTGVVYQLVPDAMRAWHAGVSYWKGEEGINHTSIGIELDNNGFEPYSEVQIETLLELLTCLCDMHHISPSNILGHQDIAPNRKIDPGPHFPWERLYENGFGVARREE